MQQPCDIRRMNKSFSTGSPFPTQNLSFMILGKQGIGQDLPGWIWKQLERSKERLMRQTRQGQQNRIQPFLFHWEGRVGKHMLRGCHLCLHLEVEKRWPWQLHLITALALLHWTQSIFLLSKHEQKPNTRHNKQLCNKSFIPTVNDRVKKCFLLSTLNCPDPVLIWKRSLCVFYSNTHSF